MNVYKRHNYGIIMGGVLSPHLNHIELITPLVNMIGGF